MKPARKLHTAERSALQGSIDAGNVEVRGDRQTKTETTGNTCTAKDGGKAHGQLCREIRYEVSIEQCLEMTSTASGGGVRLYIDK